MTITNEFSKNDEVQTFNITFEKSEHQYTEEE